MRTVTTLKSVKLVTLPTAAQGVLKVGTSACGGEPGGPEGQPQHHLVHAGGGLQRPDASFTYKATDSSGQEVCGGGRR